MSLAQLCDVTYLIILRQIRAQHAERRLMAIVAATGGQRVESPEWGDAERQLEDWLTRSHAAEVIQAGDPAALEQTEELIALGLARR